MKGGSFVGDLVRVIMSKGIVIIVGIASSIVTARFLGPENNGIIAALAVYPSLFMSVGSLGIRQSTAYFLGKSLYTEEQIKRSITQIWLFTSIISICICFMLMRYLSDSGQNIYWVLLSLIPIPFSLFNTYNSGIFLGKNQIRSFNRINWIPPLISLLLLCLFVILWSQGVSGYLLATIGGPVVMAAILLFKNNLIRSFSLKFNFKIIKGMLSLGIVYAISLLIINLNYKIDVILLDRLSTAYETGIYSKGSNIIQYLWNIPMILSTIVFARSATAKDGKVFSLKVTQLLRLSLIIIGAGALIMVVFADVIIVGMYGVAFERSVDVLRILAPGVVLLTLFKVMNMDLAGKGKPWVAMKAMIPSLAVNVVLNFLLIPEYGSIGSSWASTISYSFAAILFIYFYSKEAEIRITQIFMYRKADFGPIKTFITKIK